MNKNTQQKGQTKIDFKALVSISLTQDTPANISKNYKIYFISHLIFHITLKQYLNSL